MATDKTAIPGNERMYFSIEQNSFAIDTVFGAPVFRVILCLFVEQLHQVELKAEDAPG
jgi:hypothetical protein